MNGRSAANVFFHQRIDGCNISCTPLLSCISSINLRLRLNTILYVWAYVIFFSPRNLFKKMKKNVLSRFGRWRLPYVDLQAEILYIGVAIHCEP